MPRRGQAGRMLRTVVSVFLLTAFGVFADVVPWPIVQGKLSGHVHPSLARTAQDTLVVTFQGKGVILCSRLNPRAENWSAAKPIPGSERRPSYIPKTPHVEIYPCSLDRLPDDRLLATWNYIGADNAKKFYARPLIASLSTDAGRTWSKSFIIGPFGNDSKTDLGAMRHSMLPLAKDRWLLPLREVAPVVFHEKSKRLVPFPIKIASKSHMAVQIIRTAKGTLLAMAPDLLRSTDSGKTWATVSKFPGIAAGDNAQGRFLTALDDGRVVLTWGKDRDNKGIRYNVSRDDGRTWGTTRHVLPANDVTARYGSPRTVQLGKNQIATVYFNRFGLYLIRVTLD